MKTFNPLAAIHGEKKKNIGCILDLFDLPNEKDAALKF